MIELLASRWAYATFVLLMVIGLYMMIANVNLVKKVIGMNLFQTAVFLFFIASAYVAGGEPPIVHSDGGGGPYVSPLPHVIVLTATAVRLTPTTMAVSTMTCGSGLT